MATYIPIAVEDTAKTNGGLLVPIGVVRNDAGAAVTDADGDNSAIAADSAGRLGIADLGGSITVDASALPLPTGAATETSLASVKTAVEIIDDSLVTQGTTAPTKVNVVGGKSNDLTAQYREVPLGLGGRSVIVEGIVGGTAQPVGQVTAASLNAQVVGAVAHDAVDSGNPIKIGGKARTTNPTAVADADRVDAMYDDVGRLVTVMGQPRDLVDDVTLTLTNTTTATAIDLGEASVFHDIVSLVLVNTSSTGTEVQLLNNDGITVRMTFYVPANDVRGIVFSVPLKNSAVNSPWKLKTVTSIASLKATMQYLRNV